MNRDLHPSVRPGAIDSFTSFYKANYRSLTTAILFLAKNVDLTEEVCQEAFARIWSRWARVSRMSRPDGYLFRVALNVLRDLWRAQQRRPLVFQPASTDAIQQVVGRTALEKALLELPIRQRTALVLTELLGYDSTSAARIMKIRPGTVRALCVTARATLTNQLSREELDQDD